MFPTLFFLSLYISLEIFIYPSHSHPLSIYTFHPIYISLSTLTPYHTYPYLSPLPYLYTPYIHIISMPIYRCNPKKATMISVMIFVLSFVYALPYLIYGRNLPVGRRNCLLHSPGNSWATVYMWSVVFFGLILPITIISRCV